MHMRVCDLLARSILLMFVRVCDPQCAVSQPLTGVEALADLFAICLDYESTANGAMAQFNGNIASCWREVFYPCS